MGKKGTKKKIKWHSLPMEDTSNAANATHGALRDPTFVEKPISAWRLPTTKPPSISSQISSNTNTDNAAKPQPEMTNGSQENIPFGSSDHQSRPPSHRRRNFHQNSYHGAGRHFGHRISSSSGYRNGYFSQNTSNRDNSKPTFNEDEYTRITTPRQDVLFKKGYLSRPRNITSANITDSTTTPLSSGSGAVSVASMDDSATPSTQSVSPEHCHSVSETSDGDYHPFMYPGFVDQNGILYVNPYTTFDPYGNGQMVMMPYAVNNMSSMDLYNAPLAPCDAPCSSIDSQITSPDTASLHNEETRVETPPTAAEGNDEEELEDENNTRESHLNPNSINFYPQSLPPFHQPPTTFFYTPCIVDSPLMSLCDDLLPYDDLPPDETDNRSIKDENKIVPEAKNLSHATSDKDEESYNDEDKALVDNEISQESLPSCLENHPDEAQMINVIQRENVSCAFKSTLNVEVKEFHPRNYHVKNEIETNETTDGVKETTKKTSKKEFVNRKRQNQPYSQLMNNRKLLQEATKSIQEQNIDLLKGNLGVTYNTMGPGDTKWQTVVKPRGRKGRSVAIENENDDEIDEELKQKTSNDDGNENVDETLQSSDIPVNSSPNCGRNGTSKKSTKSKKKTTTKKNKKQRQCIGFEVIEPDFGRIVLNKKTEITHDTQAECEGDSEIEEIGADENKEVILLEEKTNVSEDNIIDVCNDEECRELEAELQNIECILNSEVDDNPQQSEESDKILSNEISTFSSVEHEEREIQEILKKSISPICEVVENQLNSPSKEHMSELHEEVKESGTQQEEERQAHCEKSMGNIEEEKISLTEIVTKWLDEKYRTNSTDNLFRLPDDPVVLQRLYESALVDTGSEETNDSDSEEDTCVNEISLQSPIQLKNQVSLSEDDSIDTDSDYQSDGQGKNIRMTSISSTESFSPGQKPHEKNITGAKAVGSQSMEDGEEQELIKGSPKLKITSINSLNYYNNCSNSATSDSSPNTTLQDKTYTKTPVMCILM